ncbi:cell division protein Fic [Clostridia bacterium]|nr:cell division protein Fic [Clostridia bacterium]
MAYTKIEELQKELKAMRPLSPTELKRIQEEFIIDDTYNSNAIEGNSLTLRETALILKEGITIGEKPLKDHLEAIGHRDAFEFVISLANASASLAEQTIKQIHSLVLMNDATHKGIYRDVPIQISGSAHTPPQPYMVPDLVEQLLAEYEQMKKDCPKSIIEAIAEFHLRFEDIHPFIDGNGRTGRLIMNFELIKAGLLPVNIKYADRKEYYECFDAYFSPEGNRSSAKLCELISKYEEEELERYLDILKSRKDK